MTGAAAILLGAVFSGLVVAIVLVATGRWEPRTASTGRGGVARRVKALWRGPYRGAAQRRAHQRRLILAAVAALAALLYTGIPVFAVITLVAVPGVPWLLGAAKLEKEAIARLTAIESWTRRVRDRVVTGTGLQQAMVASRDDVPEAIATEVTTLVGRLQAGHDPIDALYLLADDLADENADAVIIALIRFMKLRGAKLSEVLGDTADSFAAEIAGRRATLTKGKSGHTTLAVLTSFGVAAGIAGMLVPVTKQAYSTPAGQMFLLVGVGAFVGLLLLARRITLPRRPGRFLVRPSTSAAGAR